ncbi:MAG: glycosyltransferase family 2 protein [Candidatus Eisenbacteria bacterium]|nr:glycosyltransferase family 2 protein [Candidatus Eisenbacteria bacterium]
MLVPETGEDLPRPVAPKRAVQSLSVAIPAYNEAENIAGMVDDVIREIGLLADDVEIIVVDDGSKDATAEVVRGLAARHPQVRLVRHQVNQGYGAAVFDGLDSATKDLVFFTDGDRQFDLAEVRNLLDRASTADLVVGYRAPRRDPPLRRLNGKGWSLLVTMLFGYTARDIDCAFKLMRRPVIRRLRGEVRSRGATFSAEFLVRAKRAGFRIVEVPIRGHRPRVAGSPTGAKPSVVFRAFGELIRFRLSLWRERAPA